MNRDAFVARYGAIYEHSAWVPERAWDGGIDLGADVGPAFRRVVDRASRAEQLALLRAHPDLAGRLAIGSLTPQSAAEQAAAGLLRCTADEFAQFHALNEDYVKRFGFPFIIAVTGLSRADILAAFGQRVDGTQEEEFRNALGEVHRIAQFRLAALRAGDTPRREPVAPARLKRLVVAALAAAGADAANAEPIAETICAAERDGARSHGLFRLPAVVEALRRQKMNGRAMPRMLGGPEGVVIVDGDRGAAAVAYAVALPELADRARRLGVAALALRNAAHIAALWPEVEWLAGRGLAAFACTANFPYLAPHGGRRPFFGTNPIAFAYPRHGAPPLAFDMASAAMARGEIMLAARDGREVPPGVGLGADGEPTVDPAAILAGAQLPFGGHKGSMVALMVEMLAAGVVGDLFSDQAAVHEDETGVPIGGVFVLALAPERIGGPGVRCEAERFLARLAAEPGVRLPGAQRHARRAAGGPVEVDAALLATLEELAGTRGAFGPE